MKPSCCRGNPLDEINLVERVNSLTTKMHDIFLGQPVLVIYMATLAAQHAIKEHNPGVAEQAERIVKDLDGFYAAEN